MVDIRQTEAVGPEYGGRLCELRDRLLNWNHCGTWSQRSFWWTRVMCSKEQMRYRQHSSGYTGLSLYILYNSFMKLDVVIKKAIAVVYYGCEEGKAKYGF